MRRQLNPIFIAMGALLIIAVAVVYVIIPNLPQATTTLRLGDGVFKAKVLADDSSRAIGLDGATTIAADKAFLWAYPSAGKWPVVTSDNKTAVDIIWLDQDKHVVQIYTDASADSSPSVFVPRSNAVYVVELAAGTVAGKAIKSDSVAVFDINAGDIK